MSNMFRNLFKTQAQRDEEEEDRKREEKAARNAKKRSAQRDAKRKIGALDKNITFVRDEMRNCWEEAKQFVKQGEKQLAQDQTKNYAVFQKQVRELNQQKTFAKLLYVKKVVNGEVQEALNALGVLSKAVTEQPESTEKVMDRLQEELATQEDIAEIWREAAEENSVQDEEGVPTEEDLYGQLVDEVMTEREVGSNVSEDISEQTKRLQDLMGGEDQ